MEALVKPLLKRANLDLIEKNYHPVSNLQFTGILIERAVTQQMTVHIKDQNLIESLQLIYRENNSPETALLKIKSEKLQVMDPTSYVFVSSRPMKCL